jgi:iron(III) transport system substrate-binding protein
MNMRRFLFPLLFVVVLVTPFLLRLVMGVSSSSSAGPGAVKLVIITSHAEGIRREFADAFRVWHKAKYGTDVAFDYIAYGSEDLRRFLADKDELYSPSHPTLDVDLAWGGGDFLFDKQLKYKTIIDGGKKKSVLAYLQPADINPAVMVAAFPSPTLSGLPLYDLKDKPPYWIGTALSGFGITYNRDVLRYLKLPDPTTWADLADPKYANWVIAADPTRSTSAKQAFMAIVERAMVDATDRHESEDAGWAKGMGMVRLICSNARMFTDGSSTVPGYIASGDGAAGMTIDYYGRTQVEAVGGDRLGYVQPVGATVINPDPIALVKGAPHREVALHFIEFVLSPAGQMLWDKRAGTVGGPKVTNLRRLPIMPSIYKTTSDLVDTDDPFTSSGGFNKSQAREDPTFNILGELIQASCINCLDELRDTRQQILVSPRAKELEAKLAVFPFDQAEASRRKTQYTDASPVEQLALMRKWTREFQDEYQHLRQQADGN